MSLANTLLLLVNQRVTNFIETLAANDAQKAKMFSIWRDGVTDDRVVDDIQPSKSASKLVCKHVLTTGINTGKHCGKKVSPKSKTKSYCTSHITHEAVKAPPPVLGKQQAAKLMERVKIILFKTIGGHLVDPNTQLVFDAKKMVVGKEVKGKIVPLNEDDLDFCLKQKIDVSDK